MCKQISKEGLDIQLAHSRPSLRQYLTKKYNNTITTCTLANCPIRNSNIRQKTYAIYRLNYLKLHPQINRRLELNSKYIIN